MRIFLPIFLILIAASPAAAETRSYGVSGFDRVRVVGPFSVRVTTGVPPSAKATGSSLALQDVDIRVESGTLTVQRSGSSWGGYPGENKGPVEIAIGTHELTNAVLTGAGSLSIDKVKAFEFDLVLQGAGNAVVDRIDADRVKVAASGSGVVKLAGTAKQFDTAVRGLSTLTAPGLTAHDATIAVEGAASASLAVTGTASITGSGSGSVALTGSPSCTIKAQGSGTVTGCR